MQDILDKLPTLIIISSDFYKICIEPFCGYWDIYYYKSDATELISKKSENIIDAAYDMLCWCIENRYIKTNLHIEIYRNACGYGYAIVKADSGTWMEDDNFKGPNDGGNWDTYEEALEAGIQEALKLI